MSFDVAAAASDDGGLKSVDAVSGETAADEAAWRSLKQRLTSPVPAAVLLKLMWDAWNEVARCTPGSG